jgi:hypothetical protein
MGGSVFSMPLSNALGGAVSANPTLWGSRISVWQDRTRKRAPCLSPTLTPLSRRERGNRYAGGVMPGQVLSLTIHGSVDPICLKATNRRP